MIEWSRVEQLRDEVGADGFGEVVELFLEEVEEVIERLKQGCDPTRLEGELHFLKGSALSLGFTAFSDLCHDGERKSAAGQAASVDLNAIIDGFEQSKSQFFALLPRHLAA